MSVLFIYSATNVKLTPRHLEESYMQPHIKIEEDDHRCF